MFSRLNTYIIHSIAVVVPSRRQKLPGPIKNNLFPIYGPHQVGRSNEHQHEYRALVGREIEWTDELLESMQSSPYKQCRRFALTDIPHRKPIGIITADDIINTLVMESGRDEAGYYKGDKPKPAASMWGLDVLHEIKTMPAKKRRGLSKAVLAGAGGGGMGPAGGVAGAFAAGRLGAAGRAGVAIGGAGVAVGDP